MKAAGMICVALLTSAAQAAWSQDFNGRVSDAINALPSVADRTTEEAMEQSVVPYEGDNPPEAAIGHGQIEDAARQRTIDGSLEGGIYNLQVQSVLNRPQITLPDDPLALADSAIADSEEMLGGTIDPDGEACHAFNDGPTVSGEYFCHILNSDRFQFCAETRAITVDRIDDWSCQTETASFNRTCQRGVTYTCAGRSGEACLEQNLLITGPQINRFSASFIQLAADMPQPDQTCQLIGSTFEIERRALIQLTELSLTSGVFDGAGQVLVNGNVVLSSVAGGLVEAGDPGDLRLETVSCGAGCVEQHVFVGSTDLGACHDAPTFWNAFMDLRWAMPNDQAEVAQLTGTERVLVSMPSRTVSVSLLQASTSAINPIAYLAAQGSCCSAMFAQGNATC